MRWCLLVDLSLWRSLVLEWRVVRPLLLVAILRLSLSLLRGIVASLRLSLEALTLGSLSVHLRIRGHDVFFMKLVWSKRVCGHVVRLKNLCSARTLR